jgi:hypothetical protein
MTRHTDDKRGVGSSSGDWLDSTLDDLAADATAALGFRASIFRWLD